MKIHLLIVHEYNTFCGLALSDTIKGIRVTRTRQNTTCKTCLKKFDSVFKPRAGALPTGDKE